MSSAINIIREYITNKIEQGVFTPGCRLPSYSKLQEQFGYSYKTIQDSMKRLQREKLIDVINGMGCYIATPNTLKITFNISSTTLNFKQLQELFDKYVDKSLRIEVELSELDPLLVKTPKKETDITIAVFPYNLPIEIPGLSHFNFFPDFDEVIQELHFKNTVIDNASYIPFFRNTSQMGVNLDLLNKSGLSVNDLDNNFDWCYEINKKYQVDSKGGEFLPFKNVPLNPWWFGNFLPLFFHLLINEKQSPEAIYHPQLFNTKSGSKLLDIISFHEFDQNKNSFYDNKSLVALSVGSWLTMQKKNRRDFKVDNLLIKPYEFNTRKICLLNQYYIQTFIHHDLNVDNRNRIWDFIKILTSKPFQLDFCNLSGMLSARKDIDEKEYTWNDRGDFAAFIPNKDDIIIPQNLFASYYPATIATLIEQYLFFNAEKQAILEQLDEKIAYNPNLKLNKEKYIE